MITLFLTLMFTPSFARAGNGEIFFKQIEKLRALPGNTFPAKCWDGFTDPNNTPPEYHILNPETECRPNDPKASPKTVHVSRSGKLIFHVGVLDESPKGFVCTPKNLADFMGVPFARVRETNESGSNRNGPVYISYEAPSSPELIVKATCVPGKVVGFQVLTLYSMLSLIPKLKLPEPKIAEPPYFILPIGKTVPEVQQNIDQRMLTFKPFVANLGPLARRLWDDNVAWAKDPAEIETRLKLLRGLAPPAESILTKARDDAETKNFKMFSQGSKCWRRCVERGLFTGVPPEKIEDVGRQIEVRCQRVCPNFMRDAGKAEVERINRWVSSGENNVSMHAGSFSTDLTSLYVGVGTGAAYAYKFGFLTPGGPTVIKDNRIHPDFMNTDRIAAAQRGSFPRLSPSQDIAMDELNRTCTDCTATATKYKIILAARNPETKALDLWTAEQGGKLTHLVDGFPLKKPEVLEMAAGFAGSGIDWIDFRPEYDPHPLGCQNMAGQPGLNKVTPEQAKTRLTLECTDLRKVDLHGLNLKARKFTSSDLSGANLSGADLTYADLSDAKLNDANLRGVTMTTGKFGSDAHGAVADGNTKIFIPRDQLEKLGVVFKKPDGSPLPPGK